MEKNISRKTWLTIAVIVVIIAAAAIIAGVIFCRDNGDTEILTADLIFTPDSPVVYAQPNSDFVDGIGWFYGFNISCTGDTPLTITEAYEYHTSSVNDEIYHIYYDDALIDNIFGSHVLNPGANYRWSGGMPAQDISSVTLVIKGEDENGNPHEFSGMIELVYEPEAVEPLTNAPELTIVPAENPVAPVENSDFSGGRGWFYALVITNTGNSDITITALKNKVTNGAGEVFENEFPADTITNVFGDNVLEMGLSARFTGGMPVQDIVTLELTVVGVDSEGNACEFSGSVEFTQ